MSEIRCYPTQREQLVRSLVHSSNLPAPSTAFVLLRGITHTLMLTYMKALGLSTGTGIYSVYISGRAYRVRWYFIKK